jgi:signal transduction histidine kinase
VNADPRHPTLGELRSEVAELRASRERIVLAADAERRELERELHRGVQQHLVALSVGLQLASLQVDVDPEGAKAAIDEMRRDVEQAVGEAAQLAERIHPPLVDVGLAVALRAAVAGGLGFPASVDADAIAHCPPEIALTILRCCRQALGAPGAGPPAGVTVREDGDEVVVEIVVSGTGAEAHDALRDRVQALGGRLAVTSDRDATTRLTASLPLQR